MQLFGIDEASAQRLIASAPIIFSQQARAHEAEACAQALRRLGARVVVEPAHPAGLAPAPVQGQWSEPRPYPEDLLPQPRRMPIGEDADLEFDMLSAHEPDLLPEHSVSPAMRDPLDLELSLSEPDGIPDDTALRRPRQEAIDLQGLSGENAPSLELDAVTITREQPAPTSAAGARPRAEAREPPTGPQPIARGRAAADGPSPHARAAVVERRAADGAASTRTLPLLQVCFAVGVAATGYWIDSSIIYGSAGPWSVVAHGLALHQLALGVRGLFS